MSVLVQPATCSRASSLPLSSCLARSRASRRRPPRSARARAAAIILYTYDAACEYMSSNSSPGRDWSPVCPISERARGQNWESLGEVALFQNIHLRVILSRSQTISAHFLFPSIKAKPAISLSLSRVHTFQSTDYEPMWFCAIPHFSGSIGSCASDETSR